MSVTRKQIATVAPVDLGERMIRFCISNETEDRDGDILVASGCDFTNFAKNPQFLGFHRYWDFPLGTPKKWWVDKATRKVYADVYFPTVEELTDGKPENASEAVKLVDTTYHMYKTGMLSAVSVGFVIISSEQNSTSKREWGKRITKWELLEFSAVPIPSNPNALAEAVKSFDPSGVVLHIFEEAQEKAGARLSAATLDKIGRMKGCYQKIADAMEEWEMVMKELMGDEEEEDETVLEIED